MFFKPFYELKGENSLYISPTAKVITEEKGFVEEYCKQIICPCQGGDVCCNEIRLIRGIPMYLKEMVMQDDNKLEEAYAVFLGEKTTVYAESRRGLIYGISTIRQLQDCGELKETIIFDFPDKQIRGYRVYTPSRAAIDDFKDVLDMLVYYKYNSIIIEVGGAMQYKRHPEINIKWAEFTAEMKKHSGKTWEVQFNTYPWCKNSIHVDNGFGDVLTQNEMREIVRMCKERELEVIPEVPSLSHSDYIVMAYSDLNERVEDAYPDTYCPSNPKSYDVLFDIIDEVTDVFEPKYLNIGHDELYTIGVCKKCKEKDPVDLYVGDIERINNYLKSKNIKCIMWAEKVFNITDDDGKPLGGAANPQKGIPALYKCLGKIPKDITLMNWYWSICKANDEINVTNNGYNMIYGNFNALYCRGYRDRTKNVNGGFVSNWGAFGSEYMQRNGQNLSLVFTAWAFWNKNYCDDMRQSVFIETQKELYRRYCEGFKNKSVIKILHTTDFIKTKKYPFYDGIFIIDDEWVIGNYEVFYKDNTKVLLPVKFGYNISNNSKEMVMKYKECINCDALSLIEEVIGATLPEAKNNQMWYETTYENPFPNKEIDHISFKKCINEDFKVFSNIISF